MGNRAVITASKEKEVRNSLDLGVYLHWNGGRDSVEAFLTYCKMRGFRAPESDDYGWACLCMVIGNFFGDGMSVGIGCCGELDCDNWDNGTYIIERWKIVDRKYMRNGEQHEHEMLEMLFEIDAAQPAKQQMGQSKIKKALQDMIEGEEI